MIDNVVRGFRGGQPTPPVLCVYCKCPITHSSVKIYTQHLTLTHTSSMALTSSVSMPLILFLTFSISLFFVFIRDD